MIPLSSPYISGNEWRRVKRSLDSGWVSTSGPFVAEFEQAVCRAFAVPHAVACASATAGLFIALKVAGVAQGDEVLVPTVTFISPVNAVSYQNAHPVFMDCDDFLNIDPDKLEEFCRTRCRLGRRGLVNISSGRRVSAIIAVHVFGNPCRMERIMRIARAYKLAVVEDAAESLGASFTEGRYAGMFTGAIGDIGVYSFNANKIVTAGNGGMIVTGRKGWAERARYLIHQAKDDPRRYIHHEIGYNLGMTNLQAAFGLSQFRDLRRRIRVKEGNFKRYRKLLAGIPGISLLGAPPGTAPNYWFYSLLIDKRRFKLDTEGLMGCLEREGIQTRPLWRLNHLQKPYRANCGFRIETAPAFSRMLLNIPCSVGLTRRQITDVASAIRRAGKRHGAS